MNDNSVLTLHPQGKKGVNILKTKYDIICDFIIKTIESEGQIPYSNLSNKAVEELTDFDGKVVWYIVSVKLDLEARGIIKRVPKTSPHELILCE